MTVDKCRQVNLNVINAVINYHFNKSIKEKIRLENGWKESWLLVLSNDQKVVFRACDDYTHIFEREKFFYDSINKSIGKICPDVYVVDGSCQYFDKAYQISEYIEGKTLRHILQVNKEECKEEIYYKIGETVACINQIQIDSNHPYVNDEYSWENYYAYKLLKPQLERIVKNQFLTNDETQKLCSKMSGLKANITRSFLHRDIRPDNILYRDGKLFVIDAETCEFGDPLNDLARINLEWHYWEMYESLLDGYKSVMRIDTDNELFYFYQLELLAEILNMHYNHGCMNSTTPFFKNKFDNIKEILLN